MENIFYTQLSRCLSMMHSTHLEINNDNPDGLFDHLWFQPSSSLLTAPTLTSSRASTGQTPEVGLDLSDGNLHAPATLCSMTRSESIASAQVSIKTVQCVQPRCGTSQHTTIIARKSTATPPADFPRSNRSGRTKSTFTM